MTTGRRRAAAPAPDLRLRLVVRMLVWVLAASMAVLAASGVVLVWVYRPEVAGASSSPWIRDVHQVTSVVALWTAGWLCVALVARWVKRRRHGDQPAGASRLAAGVALAVGVLFASFSGLLLAWDELALWALTADELRGIDEAAFSDGVRFVLFDGTEVSQGSYRTWTLIHTLGAPLLLAAAGWVFGRLHRGDQPPPPVQPRRQQSAPRAKRR